jgi:hypothetical protein
VEAITRVDRARRATGAIEPVRQRRPTVVVAVDSAAAVKRLLFVTKIALVLLLLLRSAKYNSATTNRVISGLPVVLDEHADYSKKHCQASV